MSDGKPFPKQLAAARRVLRREMRDGDDAVRNDLGAELAKHDEQLDEHERAIQQLKADVAFLKQLVQQARGP